MALLARAKKLVAEITNGNVKPTFGSPSRAASARIARSVSGDTFHSASAAHTPTCPFRSSAAAKAKDRLFRESVLLALRKIDPQAMAKVRLS